MTLYLQCWPYATDSTRHMSNVRNEQSVVVAFGTGQPNTGSPVWRHVVMIDTYVDAARVGRYEAGGLRGGLIDVLHKAVSWIATLYMVSDDERLVKIELTLKKLNMEKKFDGR